MVRVCGVHFVLLSRSICTRLRNAFFSANLTPDLPRFGGRFRALVASGNWGLDCIALSEAPPPDDVPDPDTLALPELVFPGLAERRRKLKRA